MIKIRNRSRMGNQLFEYAFAISAAKRLGTSFCIDDLRDLTFFRLNGPAAVFRNQLANARYERRVARLPKGKEVILKLRDHAVPPEEHLKQLRDDATYVGNFQSALFFDNATDEVRKSFRIRRKFRLSDDSELGRMLQSKRVISLHVRGTDYQEFGGGRLGSPDMRLPREYYLRALAAVPRTADDVVLAVTDDAEYAKEMLRDLPDVRVVSNSPMSDFQVLMRSRAVIMSNSTFCWWACWLNERPDKLILGPRYWLGFKIGQEFPVSVIPPDWQQIDVLG